MELINNIKGVAYYMISLFYINVIILIMFVDYYESFIVHYWSFNLKATSTIKLNNNISKQYEQK